MFKIIICVLIAIGIELVDSNSELPKIPELPYNITVDQLKKKVEKNDNSVDCEVIIVGSGMAGLSAAQHLLENGVKSVIIFEAQNRTGGRIHSVPFVRPLKLKKTNPRDLYGRSQGVRSYNQFPGDFVELGANWIHGANQANSVYNLAAKYGLINKQTVTYDIGTILHNSGVVIDQKLAAEVLSIMKGFDKIAAKLKREFNNMTTKDYFDIQLEQLLEKRPSDEHKAIKSVYNNFKQMTASNWGDDLELVSAYDDGPYLEIGEDTVADGGFRLIMERLLNEIGQHHILLNHEVINVDWNQKPVRIQVKTDSKDINTFTANYVIITPSVGVLKAKHKELFNPNLPQNKSDAIENIGFGRVGKVFLYYSKPFWSSGTLKNLKFARDDDVFDKLSEDHWEQDINGFQEVDQNQNVLLGWTSGKETIHMEMAKEEELINKCTALLRQFTGDPSIPKPDSALKTDWVTNPYFRGTYSYPSLKSKPTDRELYAQPLPSESQPWVLFAGEASHQHYYSTTHGARSTGLNQAINILKDIKSNS